MRGLLPQADHDYGFSVRPHYPPPPFANSPGTVRGLSRPVGGILERRSLSRSRKSLHVLRNFDGFQPLSSVYFGHSNQIVLMYHSGVYCLQRVYLEVPLRRLVRFFNVNLEMFRIGQVGSPSKAYEPLQSPILCRRLRKTTLVRNSGIDFRGVCGNSHTSFVCASVCFRLGDFESLEKGRKAPPRSIYAIDATFEAREGPRLQDLLSFVKLQFCVKMRNPHRPDHLQPEGTTKSPFMWVRKIEQRSCGVRPYLPPLTSPRPQPPPQPQPGIHRRVPLPILHGPPPIIGLPPQDYFGRRGDRQPLDSSGQWPDEDEFMSGEHLSGVEFSDRDRDAREGVTWHFSKTTPGEIGAGSGEDDSRDRADKKFAALCWSDVTRHEVAAARIRERCARNPSTHCVRLAESAQFRPLILAVGEFMGVQIFDPATLPMECIGVLPTRSPENCRICRLSGDLIAVSGWGRHLDDPSSADFVSVYDLLDGSLKSILRFSDSTEIFGLCYIPSPVEILLTGNDHKNICLWNPVDASVIASLAETDAPEGTFALYSDPIDRNRLFAAGKGTSAIREYDLETTSVVRLYEGHREDATVWGVNMSDHHSLISSCDDGTIRQWSTGSVQMIHCIEESRYLNALSYVSDESKLLVGGDGGVISIYDVRNLSRKLEKIQAHARGCVRDLVRCSHSYFVSGSTDSSVSLLRIDCSSLCVKDTQGRVNGVCCSSSVDHGGRTLVFRSAPNLSETEEFWNERLSSMAFSEADGNSKKKTGEFCSNSMHQCCAPRLPPDLYVVGSSDRLSVIDPRGVEASGLRLDRSIPLILSAAARIQNLSGNRLIVTGEFREAGPKQMGAVVLSRNEADPQSPLSVLTTSCTTPVRGVSSVGKGFVVLGSDSSDLALYDVFMSQENPKLVFQVYKGDHLIPKINQLVSRPTVSNRVFAAFSRHFVNNVVEYDTETGRIVRCQSGHRSTVTALSLEPDPNGLLISASRDETLRLWSQKTPHCEAIWRLSGMKFADVERNLCSPSALCGAFESRLVFAGVDGFVVAFDLRKVVSPLDVFRIHERCLQRIVRVGFRVFASIEGPTLSVWSDDGSIQSSINTGFQAEDVCVAGGELVNYSSSILGALPVRAELVLEFLQDIFLDGRISSVEVLFRQLGRIWVPRALFFE